MVKPVHIFVDRKELIGFTSLRLRRSKNEMTGELTIDVFMGWLPTEPVMIDATTNREVLVYIGGHLAFTGFIDRRMDTSFKKNDKVDRNLNIGPDSYNVTFTCRGKTRDMIDSSHQHPTGTFLRPSNRSAFEDLTAPFGTELEWEADEIDLDKVRLRDGGRVADELQRLCEQTSLYVYETRDGKLKVLDGSEAKTGEPLILGQNILNFQTDQAVDVQRNRVEVKGQRIETDVWGESAVVPTRATTEDSTVERFAPETVQVYGNATDEILARRVEFEINKRASQAKQVEVDVFHVQQTDLVPWDLGTIHYVEIPPAGVFDLMEVTELTYEVQADSTIQTKLVLAPAPVKFSKATGSTVFLADVAEVDDQAAVAATRRARSAVSFGTGAGQSWSGPQFNPVENIVTQLVTTAREFLGDVSGQDDQPAPLELPPGYESETNGT